MPLVSCGLLSSGVSHLSLIFTSLVVTRMNRDAFISHYMRYVTSVGIGHVYKPARSIRQSRTRFVTVYGHRVKSIRVGLQDVLSPAEVELQIGKFARATQSVHVALMDPGCTVERASWCLEEAERVLYEIDDLRIDLLYEQMLDAETDAFLERPEWYYHGPYGQGPEPE